LSVGYSATYRFNLTYKSKNYMSHFGKRRLPVVLFILILPFNCLVAQITHSDNNDGTYINPVIFADFPDPDVIFVADTYYMVSTTMFIFPGVTILKSYDLVNWEYCSTPLRFQSLL